MAHVPPDDASELQGGWPDRFTPSAEIKRTHHKESAPAACVPRRFGVGTLLVISAAFSVLFAISRASNTPLPVLAVVCGVLVVVALMQMYVGPQRARTGSMLVGAILLFIYASAQFVDHHRDELYEAFRVAALAVLAMVAALAGGAILGYLAGAVVAGVFLLIDMANRRLHPSPTKPAMEADQQKPASPVQMTSDAGE